jgi:3',5'-cyclic AMP phosphodiesterase CpdA
MAISWRASRILRLVRIAVTADLHYDPSGQLTPPYMVEALALEIQAEEPDAVIIAGDLAHGLTSFSACLACFRDFSVPVGVLAGNHDIWRDEKAGHSSAELWEKLLPEAVASAGAVWLEREALRIGDMAVVGSMVWYDYSAIDPAHAIPMAEIVEFKQLIHADAHWIDWERTDREFAAELNAALSERLAQTCGDRSIRAAVVATHTPILEEQLLRKPYDSFWGVSNAFFGNLTTGRAVLKEPKVRVVVSGHTHIGRKATARREGMPPIECYVVPSDYGSPAHVTIEI